MIVGEAHIIVRAITASVKPEIQRAFNGMDQIGGNAGKRLGQSFMKGFNSGTGSSPLANFFKNLSSATQSARETFDALIVASYSLGPALAQLIGGISALIGALGGLIGMAAAALPSLAALGGGLLALLQTALTLKLAFSGVAEAIQAGQKAKKADAANTKKQKKDLTSYIRALFDARLALRRLRVENARQEAEANARLKEAQADLLRQEQENAQKIVEAKQDIERAQLALNDAYEAGAESLQQLNFDAEDAALAEKRAALELDKARETLLRVQDLPPNSRQRKEAELAYAQADLNYRRAIDNNKDTAKAADEANAAGVDGTKEVLTAQQDLLQAQQKLADAERKQAEDNVEGLNKIAEAQQDLIDVIIKNGQEEEDAIRRVRRAREDLDKARKAGAAQAAAADTAYKQALSELSKEQQDFVRFMVDKFIPAIDDLKAAAGKEFFPKLITAMSTIKDRLFPALEPLLTSTGSKLGDIAIDIANRLTSPKALGQIEKIWKTNEYAIEGFGKVIGNVLSAALSLLQAMRPLIKRFVDWMVTASEKINNFFNPEAIKGNGKNEFDERQKQIKDFFKKSGDIMAAFGDIFGNLFKGLNNVIMGLMEPGSGGWMLLEYFKKITGQFATWTGTAEGKNKVADYFKKVAENAIAIMDATGPLLGIIGKMGTSPAIKEFADSIKDPEFIKAVQSIADKFMAAGPALAEFVKSAANFFDLTLSSGAIQTFWNTLTGIFDTLVKFFENPVVAKGFLIFAQLAATLIALRTAWRLLKIPMLAVLNPLAGIGGIVTGAVDHLKNLKKAGDAARDAVLAANASKQAAAKAAANSGDFVGMAKNLSAQQAIPKGGIIGALGPALSGLAGAALPILAITAAIAGLAAAFIAMWRESETFRNAIKKLIDGVMKKATEIFETLKKKLDEALKPLGGMKGTVDKLKAAFKWLGDILGEYVIPFIEGGLKNALDIIGAVFGTIIDTVGNVIEAVMGIIDAVKAGDWKGVFENIVKLITAPFTALGSNLIELVKNIFNNMIDAVKDVLGISSPSTVFIDIAKQIIMGLVNGFKALAKLLFDTFLKPFKDVFLWFTNTAIPWFKELPGKVYNAAKAIWDFLIKLIATAWLKVTGWWDTTGKTFFLNLPGKILGWGAKIWNFLGDKISSAWTAVTTFFGPDGTAAKFIRGLGSTIATWARGIWDGLFNGLKATWNKIADWWKANISSKTFEFPNPLKPWEKITIKVPPLPRLMAAGGTVLPTPGGTLARIAEAGRPERVEPLDPDGLSKRDKAMIKLLTGPAGGSPITMHIYPSEGMDERELAKMINRELAFQMRKGAA
jgi:phage-related protein